MHRENRPWTGSYGWRLSHSLRPAAAGTHHDGGGDFECDAQGKRRAVGVISQLRAAQAADDMPVHLDP
jgi:hypothetical protein